MRYGWGGRWCNPHPPRIPLFSETKLLTRKRVDFKLWSQAINLINKKQHLTLEGLSKIRIIKLKIELNRKGILNSIN